MLKTISKDPLRVDPLLSGKESIIDKVSNNKLARARSVGSKNKNKNLVKFQATFQDSAPY